MRTFLFFHEDELQGIEEDNTSSLDHEVIRKNIGVDTSDGTVMLGRYEVNNVIVLHHNTGTFDKYNLAAEVVSTVKIT